MIEAGIDLSVSQSGITTVWAELGSGRGAFTLALAEIVDEKGQILSIDKNRSALQHQENLVRARYPQVGIEFLHADFTQPLSIGKVDGLLMANSLHFIKDKDVLLKQVLKYLKPGGRFILVEYDVDRGNHWVPYPLSFRSWQFLAPKTGLIGTRLINTRPSSFLGRFYSAVSFLR